MNLLEALRKVDKNLARRNNGYDRKIKRRNERRYQYAEANY